MSEKIINLEKKNEPIYVFWNNLSAVEKEKAIKQQQNPSSF